MDSGEWRLLGIGAKGWRRIQHGIGILNAFCMIWAYDDGRYIGGLVSAYSVLVCARWRIPR